MRKTLVGVCMTVRLLAQADGPVKGAKSLFLDPTSGASLAPANATAKKPKPAPSEVSAQARAGAPVNISNAGLMYYVERELPGGRVERVNTNATFRSGDRIRIHLRSNVSGTLAIVQRNAIGDGSSVLFPDSRLNGGLDRIRAQQLMALPSEASWFRFDDQPGDEHVLVMLTPDGAESGVSLASVSSQQLDPQRTEQLSNLVQTQKGDKALVIEVDENRSAPATYVVQSRPQHRRGVITAEIVLQHR